MIPLIHNPLKDHWYLSATCSRCCFRILIFDDLNEGRGSINGTVHVTCPNCISSQNLPLEHYRHQASGTSIGSQANRLKQHGFAEGYAKATNPR
jgi:hypothetical protein